MQASLSSPVAPPSTTWPRLEACAGCGEQVLRARHVGAGQPFKLDPVELFPEGPCGECRGTGRTWVRLNATSGHGLRGDNTVGAHEGRLSSPTPVECSACAGTGQRGESAPLHVIAVDADGIARTLRHGNERQPGEALHRRHRCP